MKHMKKMLAFVATLVMVLSMSITAFAGTITVPETDTHTYAVYQIFTGDLTDGKLSNIQWGINGTGTGYVDAAVTNEIAALEGKSDTEKLAVIKKYAKLTGDAYATVSKTSEVTATPGYYLIKDAADVTGNDAATLYIVKVVGDVTINRKSAIPSVDKDILDDGPTNVNEASIGNTVKYQFTGTLPSDYADYNSYYYMFSDTMSKGLTFTEGSIKVYVKNGEADPVDVTKYFYTEVGTYSAVDGTKIEVSIADLVALNNVDGVTVNAATKIIVTYEAKLNANAVIAGAGNPNKVALTFSNNPNDSGDGKTNNTPKDQSDEPEKPTTTHPTGKTPESEVKTFTTELTILKTDAKNKFLPGTEFKLSGNGVDIILVTTDTFEANDAGTYYKLKNGTYTETPPTAESYVEKTAGENPVVATADVPIYTKNGDTYTAVTEVAAGATYYVKQSGNVADYDSTTTKYAKTTTVTQKGATETATDVVGVIGADGTVTFKGLGAGEYTITETNTLPGYNTIEPITFNVSVSEKSETELTLKFAADNGITLEADNTLATTIINYTGSTLPETGGIGTTIFYVLGSLMAISAAVILIAKRRAAR